MAGRKSARAGGREVKKARQQKLRQENVKGGSWGGLGLGHSWSSGGVWQRHCAKLVAELVPLLPLASRASPCWSSW